MTPEAERLIRRFSRHGVIVDTNVLLLYVVGITDPGLIGNFKRTKQFTIEDFDVLVEFLERFHRRVTTPHILTEVSNWIGYLPDDVKMDAFDRLAAMIQVFLTEELQVALPIARQQEFRRFGLTDIEIQHIASDTYLVLTDDAPLADHLLRNGVTAYNFNYLRPYID